ncbi:hypothetical protein POVWA2_010130 [Plasmodium ovale wallikeri]|uniref:Uncharacterized protein n=1 Tax=Plasmodium ovale wallikeri TaxID=864142 RepID=A0A1A8YKG4_PLAOA|nr:hypothetical protein POVWA1_009940 [Plasmodium ovale wallikeri]SBT32536.1 hypothetical protein POVWA2_010130 [Plasmodium ovale wallikeri]
MGEVGGIRLANSWKWLKRILKKKKKKQWCIHHFPLGEGRPTNMVTHMYECAYKWECVMTCVGIRVGGMKANARSLLLKEWEGDPLPPQIPHAVLRFLQSFNSRRFF